MSEMSLMLNFKEEAKSVQLYAYGTSLYAQKVGSIFEAKKVAINLRSDGNIQERAADLHGAITKLVELMREGLANKKVIREKSDVAKKLKNTASKWTKIQKSLGQVENGTEAYNTALELGTLYKRIADSCEGIIVCISALYNVHLHFESKVTCAVCGRMEELFNGLSEIVVKIDGKHDLIASVDTIGRRATEVCNCMLFLIDRASIFSNALITGDQTSEVHKAYKDLLKRYDVCLSTIILYLRNFAYEKGEVRSSILRHTIKRLLLALSSMRCTLSRIKESRESFDIITDLHNPNRSHPLTVSIGEKRLAEPDPHNSRREEGNENFPWSPLTQVSISLSSIEEARSFLSENSVSHNIFISSQEYTNVASHWCNFIEDLASELKQHIKECSNPRTRERDTENDLAVSTRRLKAATSALFIYFIHIIRHSTELRCVSLLDSITKNFQDVTDHMLLGHTNTGITVLKLIIRDVGSILKLFNYVAIFCPYPDEVMLQILNMAHKLRSLCKLLNDLGNTFRHIGKKYEDAITCRYQELSTIWKTVVKKLKGSLCTPLASREVLCHIYDFLRCIPDLWSILRSSPDVEYAARHILLLVERYIRDILGLVKKEYIGDGQREVLVHKADVELRSIGDVLGSRGDYKIYNTADILGRCCAILMSCDVPLLSECHAIEFIPHKEITPVTPTIDGNVKKPQAISTDSPNSPKSPITMLDYFSEEIVGTPFLDDIKDAVDLTNRLDIHDTLNSSKESSSQFKYGHISVTSLDEYILKIFTFLSTLKNSAHMFPQVRRKSYLDLVASVEKVLATAQQLRILNNVSKGLNADCVSEYHLRTCIQNLNSAVIQMIRAYIPTVLTISKSSVTPSTAIPSPPVLSK